MRSVQFKKVIRDILQNGSKSLLVIIGIFFGVLGIGLILNSFSVIKEEVNKSYISTNPASFSLWFNKVDKNLIESLEKLEPIEYVEPRRVVRSRVESADKEWVTTLLYVVDDFSDVKINTFTSEEGEAIPKTGEILLERMATSVADKKVGDSLLAKIPLYEAKELKISGTVHAAGLKPAWIEEVVYGFISQDTFSMLGNTTDFCQVLFTVSDDKLNKEHINEVMLETRKWCEKNGYIVNRVEIPTPGKHPNGDQVNALLFLFETFGALALVLSAVLVINLISSLLSSQIKQIGIMKSMGASRFQIARMYYAIVIVLGIAAIIFAVFIAANLSKVIVDLCADVLNFKVVSYGIPASSYIVQILAGVLVPVLAATYPILKGCKITVNDALHSFNVDKSGTNINSFSSKFSKLKFFSNTMIMSIRNTFRRRSRLLLTVATLAVGGAVFITAMNLLVSLNKTIDTAMESLNYDSLFIFSKDYKVDDISASVKGIDGIASTEIYAGGMASIIYEDKTQSNSFQFVALSDNAKGLDLPLLEGKLLSDPNSNEVVINHVFLDAHPECKVGDNIKILSNKIITEWKIVGVVKEIGGNEMIYSNNAYYLKTYSKEGMGREIAFFYNEGDEEKADAITSEIEKKLREAGIDVQSKQTINDVSSVFANHLKLIVGFLIITSVLIIIVGVIGLISSTSINILERLREIGVMRAIGASPNKIASMFVYENMIVGLISFISSSILAIPLTIILCILFGNIFLKTPLDLVYSPLALLYWFVATMLITVIVSYYVAKRSQSKPVNEIINYE